MELIPMGKRDARRLGIIEAAIAGKMTNREGAEALKLSRRQFKRLRRAVRETGPRGVVHGNRGRPSTQRLVETVRERVIERLRGEVKLNDHHIADLLEDDGVTVSAASVRRIRRDLKLPPKRRRRAPKHRRRRDRAPQRGALVLIDGSPFCWFDSSAPLWTLHGAIDDATGDILALTLRPTEDLHGYVTLLRDLIGEHGVPVALYGDRSGILIRNDPYWTLAEELAGRQAPTQFGRMLEELGVRFIAATSPQAKGRIERLWATLQDRLVAELRLHGCSTLEAAQAYLPRFIATHNRRFARPAAEAASAFRRAPRDLERILACVYERVVARDNTVSVAGRWIQIPPGPRGRSYHKALVEVRELFDGRLLVLHPRQGVIAEQPAIHGFTLIPRHAPRASRARRDAERRKPARLSFRTQKPVRNPGIGKLTNRRTPDPTHNWKKRYNPALPHPGPAGGGSKSLTR